MFMLSIIFVIVCGRFEWKRICAGFYHFVYICIAVGDLVTKSGRIGIPFTGLILPYFCACLKPEPRFSISYVVVIFYVQRVEVRGSCL